MGARARRSQYRCGVRKSERAMGAKVTAEDQVWFEDRWMVASLCDE
jgi:hypothetical protein